MMNLPSATLIKEDMNSDKMDFGKLFPVLKEHKLCGYMGLALISNNGVEEGYVLFNGGDIIAAEYHYLAKEQVIKGEDALKLFMNACAGDGKFDIYEIQAQNIVDVREKNRDCVLKYKPTQKELMGMLPESFNESTLKEETVKITAKNVKELGGVDRGEVLKKYGITNPDDKSVDKILAQLKE
jgi:hypothetical protein